MGLQEVLLSVVSDSQLYPFQVSSFKATRETYRLPTHNLISELQTGRFAHVLFYTLRRVQFGSMRAYYAYPGGWVPNEHDEKRLCACYRH